MIRPLQLVLNFLFVFVLAASAQQTSSDKKAAEQNREAAAGESSQSALEVQPGPPAIKQQDLIYDRKLSPWGRMPRYILDDQKRIWSAPFRTAKADVKWWAIFGGSTVALLATDRWTTGRLPNTDRQVRLATWTSRVGAAYTLIPVSGAFYFIGLGARNERFRETGILAFETLANTAIVSNLLKAATHRERPLEGNGRGSFWTSKGSFTNASFPSGHAINSWALASIIAHEYPRPLVVPIVSYGLASLVVGSRVAARRHFPSDVLVGAAMGWFIGDYVYARRHNRELEDGKVSAIERLMAHVHIGGPAQPAALPSVEVVRATVLQRPLAMSAIE